MTQPPQPEPHVFDSLSNRRLRGVVSAAAGIVAVLVAALGFVLSLRSSPNLLAFHSMTTMPMIMAVGLFAAAFATLRSPTRVVVGQHELTVMRGQSRVGRWRWEEIALAATANTAISSKRVLKLYGESGKILATLTDDLGDFDRLADQVKQRMAEHPSARRAALANKKLRRTGAGLIAGGLLFLALAVANGWIALHERNAHTLLQTQGQPAHAIVVRKFTAPDGRTRRIEYKVDAPNAPTENVEVNPVLWQLLQPNQRIEVTAVPGHPDISHLRAGQVDDKTTSNPNLMLLLSTAIAIMSIAFLIAGTLNWRGLELKWDRQRNRPHLVAVTSQDPSPKNTPT